jgi:hypothetical protein
MRHMGSVTPTPSVIRRSVRTAITAPRTAVALMTVMPVPPTRAIGTDPDTPATTLRARRVAETHRVTVGRTATAAQRTAVVMMEMSVRMTPAPEAPAITNPTATHVAALTATMTIRAPRTRAQVVVAVTCRWIAMIITSVRTTTAR